MARRISPSGRGCGRGGAGVAARSRRARTLVALTSASFLVSSAAAIFPFLPVVAPRTAPITSRVSRVPTPHGRAWPIGPSPGVWCEWTPVAGDRAPVRSALSARPVRSGGLASGAGGEGWRGGRVRPVSEAFLGNPGSRFPRSWSKRIRLEGLKLILVTTRTSFTCSHSGSPRKSRKFTAIMIFPVYFRDFRPASSCFRRVLRRASSHSTPHAPRER